MEGFEWATEAHEDKAAEGAEYEMKEEGKGDEQEGWKCDAGSRWRGKSTPAARQQERCRNCDTGDKMSSMRDGLVEQIHCNRFR